MTRRKVKAAAEYWPIADLVLLENNPRTIKKADMDKLVKSIKDNPDYFEARPIILSNRTGKNVIIAGNQRLKAAEQLGLKEVPAVLLEGLTEDREREIIIRDNVSNGEWDMDELANSFDIDELKEWGLDLDFTEPEKEIIEDEAPEPPAEPKSKLGEIYKLGNHYLMCGDSTKQSDVDKLMGASNGKKELADMVFTDPPWNVNYGAMKENNPQGYKPRTILNDFMGTEEFKNFMFDAFKCMNAGSKQGAVTYVVMSAQEWGNMMLTLAQNDYHWSSTIIWNKDRLVLSRKDYHTKYEPIWYGWKEGAPRLHPVEDRKQSDVWDFERPTKSDEHPTMKPVALVAKAIVNSSNEGDIILDLFGGSGTTLIASEQTGRRCRMMELDPKYIDIIITRWENLTGKKAEKVEV